MLAHIAETIFSGKEPAATIFMQALARAAQDLQFRERICKGYDDTLINSAMSSKNAESRPDPGRSRYQDRGKGNLRHDARPRIHLTICSEKTEPRPRKTG